MAHPRAGTAGGLGNLGGESIEQMLKRFKKMCEKEGLIKDVKRKSYYEKPSEQRRRRRRKSAKRAVAGVV